MTITFDLYIRKWVLIAFLEFKGNFLSKKYPQNWATAIFHIFEGDRRSFAALFAFRIIKKLLNTCYPATLLKMFLEVYIIHFCNKIPSSTDVRVHKNLVGWHPDYFSLPRCRGLFKCLAHTRLVGSLPNLAELVVNKRRIPRCEPPYVGRSFYFNYLVVDR